MIDKLIPYKIPIGAAVVLILTTGAFFTGRSVESDKWEKRMNKAQQQIRNAEIKSDSLSFVVRKMAISQIAEEQKYQEKLSAEIAKNKAEIDVHGKLPKKAIDLYNQAARRAR